MKYVIYSLLCSSFLLFAGCKKENIDVVNTQITPDLSNPIIQKLTNVTWFRNRSTTVEEWTSLDNIPKPSEAMAAMMYNIAWVNITLYRDGTSNMVYVPPIFGYTYMHCRGTWQVSKTEENTIILNTKTPVSNAIVKMKVLNLETKENVSHMKLSMDFGNRLLKADFQNSTSETRPEAIEAVDYDWFASRPVRNEVLKAEDFLGSWATSSYDRSRLNSNEKPKESIILSIRVEDLLAQTPNFISGLLFDLQPNGDALLAYGRDISYAWINMDKRVVSKAKWSVKGNKIWIDTDEEFFYSAGELMFGLTVHAPGLTYYGLQEDLPIRTQANRFYAIEVIEQREDGFWCRVTTNDAVFYAFLFKSEFDPNNTVNVKDLVE